jgi:predicted acetyltransferase
MALTHRQTNGILYSVVIFFTLGGLSAVFAALSSEEWIEMSVPQNVRGIFVDKNWDKLEIGLSRTRTVYKNIAQRYTLNVADIMVTTDLLSFWSSIYKGLNCGTPSGDLDDAISAIKLATALVVFGIVFMFAAFIVVYLSMVKKFPFKYPHFISGALYVVASLLYIIAVANFYNKMKGIENQKCDTISASFSISMLWGTGMSFFAAILCLICAGCMFFLRKNKIAEETEKLEESPAATSA